MLLFRGVNRTPQANDKTPVHKVSARVLTDPKDIAKFMQKRKKANAAG